MTDALVTDNIGLVHMHAKPFAQQPDYDDIISAGTVGLIAAAARFDGRAKISTFAGYAIRREILRYINRKSATVRGLIRNNGTDRPGMCSLDKPIGSDEGSTAGMIDSLADPHVPLAEYYDEDLVAEVRRLIETADDIPAGQRAALLRAIAGQPGDSKSSANLSKFRQTRSCTARKLKELLHADKTA